MVLISIRRLQKLSVSITVDIDTSFTGVIGIDKVIDLQVSIDTYRFTGID